MRVSGLLSAGAMFAVACVSCGPTPESKIRGWPLSEAERLALWPPTDAAGSDDATAAAADASDTPVDDDAGIVAPPPETGPCAALVAMACELYADYTDGCQEARSRPPDDRHPQTRESCAELVKRFTEVELPRVGGSCYRYTRSLCALHGETSERCRTARATIQLARSRREHRICLADWLLLETRALRR